MGSSWSHLEVLWGDLGASCGGLGASLGGLGAFLGRLGVVLGRLGVIWSRFGVCLGAKNIDFSLVFKGFREKHVFSKKVGPKAILDGLGSVLGRSWGVLGSS